MLAGTKSNDEFLNNLGGYTKLWEKEGYQIINKNNRKAIDPPWGFAPNDGSATGPAAKTGCRQNWRRPVLCVLPRPRQKTLDA